ncbi:MAG: DUF2807 domain-containing protein [Chloroflexi bacterium]|jgi:hypothetical protein|nr:DUF2807 domain-containing protein [Chloroflexota bacterium]
MITRLKILLTLSILVLATNACIPRLVRRTTPEPSSQTQITQEADLTPFNEIDIEAAGRIFLVQGTSNSIKIEGLQSVVDDISYKVSNGALVITHTNRIWGWISDRDFPTITITFENLNQFKMQGGTELVANNLKTDSLTMIMEGGASVQMENLEVDTLNLKLEGGLDFNVDGSAHNQIIHFQGGVNYDAGDLKSNSIELKLEGAGSATIWATESLDLDLSGAYNVNYYGNPNLNQNIQGVGNVESLGEK